MVGLLISGLYEGMIMFFGSTSKAATEKRAIGKLHKRAFRHPQGEQDGLGVRQRKVSRISSDSWMTSYWVDDRVKKYQQNRR